MSNYRHTNVFASLRSALKGAGHGISGRNFLIQLLLGAAALGLAYYLPLSQVERYIIILLVAVVLSAELFNTAIEELADALVQEHHPGIARVKELSAAAVFIFAVAAAIIGASIFLNYLS